MLLRLLLSIAQLLGHLNLRFAYSFLDLLVLFFELNNLFIKDLIGELLLLLSIFNFHLFITLDVKWILQLFLILLKGSYHSSESPYLSFILLWLSQVFFELIDHVLLEFKGLISRVNLNFDVFNLFEEVQNFVVFVFQIDILLTDLFLQAGPVLEELLGISIDTVAHFTATHIV